jgi:hypothetical protein
MATSLTTCEALWLRELLSGLFSEELEATVIHCDNQSDIRLSENPVFHDCSKHRHLLSLLTRLCTEERCEAPIHTEI